MLDDYELTKPLPWTLQCPYWYRAFSKEIKWSLLQAVIIIAFIIRQAAVVHLNPELQADLPVFATVC